MYVPFYNQYITPDLKPGDKLPAPKYIEKFFINDRHDMDDTIYSMTGDALNPSAFILKWNQNNYRSNLDLPSYVKMDKNGIILKIQYRSNEARGIDRMYGPAVQYLVMEPSSVGIRIIWGFKGHSYYNDEDGRILAPIDYLDKMFTEFLTIKNRENAPLKKILKTLNDREYLDLEVLKKVFDRQKVPTDIRNDILKSL